ncbi:LysR family transcriptional regulator [Actinosynnema sp. ALI-1.44]|uniref:LysR family transcriptional regulator n=1 Tax=Actinosynnema sp. ALI-1.44 TaxID=1933779 RepID=UPI00097BFA2F|nr:LysR family transcriptional regulator [Actinosynnema sp. ALI-1.44]ONI90114.1 LysR family transcriptional regulator [Actinosynnema sp. ALI-1.44]
MLDVNRLAVLVQIAHHGSITAAATQLSITPAAVSQQLAKLEREVGCPLVDRHPRGVRLTTVGTALAAHAETIVGQLRAAEQHVQVLLDQQPTHLAVGTFASAGQTLVPPALARFRREYPDVALALRDLEPPDGYGLVTSRELDLLITHGYPGGTMPDAQGLRRFLLLTDPLRLALPASDPMATRQRIALKNLTGHEWISGGQGIPNRVCLEHLARQAKVRVHVAYETADYQVTLALVAAGLGVALVPSSLLDGPPDRRVAVRALTGEPVTRGIYLAHHKQPNPLAHAMIGFLTRAAGARTR